MSTRRFRFRVNKVASKWPHNINKVRISDTYQKTQPIESTNGYAKLANLPDTTVCYDGYVTPKSTEVAQSSTNNYMNKEHRRIQHPTIILHPRNTTEQPSSSHHEVHKKQKVVNKTHKVVIVGDSHARGCASEVKQKLNSEYEVVGFTNPGSSMKDIKESVKLKMAQLTKKDIIVLWGGDRMTLQKTTLW